MEDLAIAKYRIFYHVNEEYFLIFERATDEQARFRLMNPSPLSRDTLFSITYVLPLHTRTAMIVGSRSLIAFQALRPMAITLAIVMSKTL